MCVNMMELALASILILAHFVLRKIDVLIFALRNGNEEIDFMVFSQSL